MKTFRFKNIKCTLTVLALTLLVAGCGGEPVLTTSPEPAPEPIISDTPPATPAPQPLASPSPQTLAQIQELNQEIGDLRSRIEVLEFELDKARDRQQQLYDDLDIRLRKVERLQTQTPTPTQTPQVSPEPSEQPASTEPEPETATESELPESTATDDVTVQPVIVEEDPILARETYDDAFRTLKDGQFEDAQAKFQTFINSFPNNDLVGDAWYWIAEANYIIKKLEQAIETYKFVASEFPEHRRTPDSLLKIGYIYYDLENFEEAQLYLTEVVDKYPASRSAFSARRRLDKMKRDGNIL